MITDIMIDSIISKKQMLQSIFAKQASLHSILQQISYANLSPSDAKKCKSTNNWWGDWFLEKDWNTQFCITERHQMRFNAQRRDGVSLKIVYPAYLLGLKGLESASLEDMEPNIKQLLLSVKDTVVTISLLCK